MVIEFKSPVSRNTRLMLSTLFAACGSYFMWVIARAFYIGSVTLTFRRGAPASLTLFRSDPGLRFASVLGLIAILPLTLFVLSYVTLKIPNPGRKRKSHSKRA
jgi:hypothetical protein